MDGAEELPLGFSMALAQNPRAMEHFSAMTAGERQTVLSAARAAESRREMQECVDRLADYWSGGTEG